MRDFESLDAVRALRFGISDDESSVDAGLLPQRASVPERIIPNSVNERKKSRDD
jgi:hypothetical protein